MNRYFVRFVACLLIPMLTGIDPSWANSIANPFNAHLAHEAKISAPFTFEAVVEPLDGGFVGHSAAKRVRKEAAEELESGMSRRKALLGIGLLFATPAAALAQQAPPVVKRSELPQAAAVERQNRILTDAKWQDAWHLTDGSIDPRPLENQLSVVTNNSPKVGQMFYAHREAWESLLAVRSDDGKFRTNRPDTLHAAGVSTSPKTVSQVLSYPGITATQPKRRVETADFEPIDKNHPGFLHWRTIAQYAGRALRVALDGVQVYSKNQVEMSYLQEHGEAFKVREAYADLEEAIQDEHLAAVNSWLDYAVQAQKPAELRESAWIEARNRDRERAAAPSEGGTPSEFFRLQATSERATAEYHAALNDREGPRIRWLETIGHTENDLTRTAATSLRPKGSPVWPMTRDLFSLAGAVAPLIQQEGAAETVVVPHPQPLPDEWDASRPSLPIGSYAPDNFPNTDHPMEGIGEIDESVATEVVSLFSATPIDAPLGTSPRQRLLQLQKDMIETVQLEMLELQKLPTWNIGAHVDLGTMPFIASLLNWDYRNPQRGKVLSLGELQIELELRLKEIDQEVIADRKQIRGKWLAARTNRQTALAKLIDVRNQIVTYETQRQAALRILNSGSDYAGADAVTPALQIERLKQEYARHLTEAWAALQVMKIYTVDGQKRVVTEAESHYMKVLHKIDPTYNAKPEELNPSVPETSLTTAGFIGASADQSSAQPKTSWLHRALNKITKTLGVLVPVLLVTAVHLVTSTAASAHTFAAQAAGAALQTASQIVTGGGTAAQVAMDVTLGTYNGGSESSLTGIAVNILRATHPDHVGIFSQNDIWKVVYDIARKNGIDHSRLASFHPGDTLHIGSFTSDVAQRLRAHIDPVHQTATIPQPVSAHLESHHAVVAPSHPPTIQTAKLPLIPQGHPNIVHAQSLPHTALPSAAPHGVHPGNVFSGVANQIWNSVTHMAGVAWHWTMASPDHKILVAAVVGALILLVWQSTRWKKLHVENHRLPPFSVNGIAARVMNGNARHYIKILAVPTLLAVLSIAKMATPVFHWGPRGSVSLPQGWSLYGLLTSPWALPVSLVLLTGLIIGARPSLRRKPIVRKFYVPLIATVAAMLIPGIPWYLRIALALVGSGFTFAAARLGQSRLVSLALAPLLAMGIAIGIHRTGIDTKANDYAKKRIELVTNPDLYAANYGVSFHPARLQVSSPIPRNGGGNVEYVNRQKTTLAPGDLAIGVKRISTGLADRLRKASAKGRRLLQTDTDLIDLSAIQTAERQPDPNKSLVRIALNFKSSIDREINDLGSQLDQLLTEYEADLEKTRENFETTGVYLLSFDATQRRDQIVELGAKLSAKLQERSELNVPVTRVTHLVPGTLLPDRTPVPEGGSLTLFTQEIPDEYFIQLKMTPADVRALIQQWPRNPQETVLRLMTRDGAKLDIPLTNIKDSLASNDPAYPQETEDENYYGPQWHNPSEAVARTIPVNLAVQLPKEAQAELGKGFHFRGVYVGDERILVPGNNIAIGIVSIEMPAPVAPPQRAERAPLQSRLEAILKEISALQDQEKGLLAFKDQFPERWRANVPKLVHVRAALADLNGQAEDLRGQLKDLDETGVRVADGAVQPSDDIRHRHFSLNPPVSTNSGDQGYTLLGPTELVHVSFYATERQITGDRVQVRIPNSAETIEFHIPPNYMSQGRTMSLKRFVAEATLPLAQVRRLFPPNLPMNSGDVEVVMPAPTSIIKDMETVIKTIFGKIFRVSSSEIGTEAGPSQLKKSELGIGLMWVLGIALSAGAFLGFGSAYALAWGAGYLAAVGIHEVGHRMAAPDRQQARLHWVGGNLEWRQRDETGAWQAIRNSVMQMAGPQASRRAIAIGMPILIAQTLIGIHLLNPAFLLAIIIASFVFTQIADQTTEPVSQEIIDRILAEERYPIQNQPGAAPQRAIETFRESRDQQYFLKRFKDSLVGTGEGEDRYGTILEDEVYWYRGDKMTYLTFWQIVWDAGILRRDRIPLTNAMRLVRRFERDEVSYPQAELMFEHYHLPSGLEQSGSKNKTFKFILVFGVPIALFLVFFGSPDTLTRIVEMFKGNPMVQIVTDDPLPSIGALLLTIFISGWVLLAAMESWGKLRATTPYNLREIKLQTIDKVIAPEERFEEQTGLRAPTVLEKIAKVRILRRKDPDYEKFIDDFTNFARLVTERAQHTLIHHRDFTNPSEEAIAFEEAFRIQVRRSRTSRSPIYRNQIVNLADDATLLRRLQNWLGEPIPDDVRDHFLQAARVDEALRLMGEYPVHTLMALLRSGTTESIAEIQNSEFATLIREILDELKERASTLDDDAFDDIRAQDKLADFFDTLHYTNDGLRGPFATADAQSIRERLLKWLEGADKNGYSAVRPTEQNTWENFVPQLDVMTNGSESDQNIAQGIEYVLASRRLREDETDTRDFLHYLRGQGRTHPREIVLRDRYLRDRDGRGSIDVLQLSTLYEKYMNILREFAARFPDVQIFEDRDIYILLENNVNFRQTIREVALLRHLTRGTIYLVNANETHPRFAARLKNAIADRFSRSDQRHIKVRALEFMERQIRNNPNNIILSSATPLEWFSVRKSLGVKVHTTSPLEKPALIAGLFDKLNHDKLAKGFNRAVRHYVDRYEDLERRAQAFQAQLNSRDLNWGKVEDDARAVGGPPTIERLTLVGDLKLKLGKVKIKRMGQKLDSIRRKLSAVQDEMAKVRDELREVLDLRGQLTSIPSYFQSMGLTLGDYRHGEPLPNDPPPFVDGDIMAGHYRLDEPFYLRPGEERPEPGFFNRHFNNREVQRKAAAIFLAVTGILSGWGILQTHRTAPHAMEIAA